MARFGTLFLMLMFSWATWADNSPAPASVTPAVSNVEAPPVNLEERTRAKKRLYPGGRDEEPLQVQSQLVSPTRAAVSADELPDGDAD